MHTHAHTQTQRTIISETKWLSRTCAHSYKLIDADPLADPGGLVSPPNERKTRRPPNGPIVFGSGARDVSVSSETSSESEARRVARKTSRLIDSAGG